ncbi:MAG: type II secretion system protein [Verrucomicrobiae bacterium]|nr:type II secretion system protein [Verrucomicrobiae bacterium]
MNENPDAPEPTESAAPKKPKFTLTQLLVLIAVVSVLLAMLTTAAYKPREKALRSSCLGNLKQIGLSIRLYSGDNKERFPTDALGTTLGSFALLTNNFQTSYMKWVCPSDRGITPGATNRPWTRKNLSYAYGGFGLTESVQPDTPLACDRTSGDVTGATPYVNNKWTHKSEGGNVLYADGHVGWTKELAVPMYRGKNP